MVATLAHTSRTTSLVRFLDACSQWTVLEHGFHTVHASMTRKIIRTRDAEATKLLFMPQTMGILVLTVIVIHLARLWVVPSLSTVLEVGLHMVHVCIVTRIIKIGVARRT